MAIASKQNNFVKIPMLNLQVILLSTNNSFTEQTTPLSCLSLLKAFFELEELTLPVFLPNYEALSQPHTDAHTPSWS